MSSAYIIANVQARKFNASVEYDVARKAREGVAVMRMVLVEGV